jgi:PleD family two-component response regulator
METVLIVDDNVTQLEGTTRVLEQEVTERKQTEEALRSSESRYRMYREKESKKGKKVKA